MVHFLDNNVLTPLKTKINTYDILGFDVETHGDNNNFVLGSITDGVNHTIFNSKKEAINYFMTNRKKFSNKLICATNLEFDFWSVFRDFPLIENFDVIANKSKTLAFIYRDEIDKHPITFMDTMNFLPVGVKKLGNIIGIPKLEPPKCLGHKPQNKDEYDILLKYNINDSMISQKFMQFLQEGFNKNGCELKITVSSSSLDLYRRRFQHTNIEKEQKKYPNINFNEMLFKAYYGGNTTVFKRGKIPPNKYKMYDYNSLYPSVMVNDYPRPDSVVYGYGSHKIIQDFDGVTEVYIYCPENIYYPVLPIKHDGKLLFSTGKFRGWWTNLELRKAIELGYIIMSFGKAIYYRKHFLPYKEFVENLYAQRLEHKAQESPLEIIDKLFLNSLYGKFGQRFTQKISYYDLTKIKGETFDALNVKNLHEHGNSGFAYYLENTEEVKRFQIPILPIYTTAFARLKLYDSLIKYKAIYCDTDSIVTSYDIEESKALGKFKKEYDIHEGYIIRPKLYMFNDKIKIKGVPRATKETFNDVLQKRKIKYQKFVRIRESVIQNRIVNSKVIMTKELNLNDNKRVWETDFNPYKLDNSTPRILDL
jgi:hypothetical protein